MLAPSLPPQSPLPPQWRSFPAPMLAPGYSAWLSNAEREPLWDAFLTSTPLGQFQQSSAWARVKAFDGWKATRCLVTDQTQTIVAGFQILWKRKGPLRIGYVSKGPVVARGRELTFQDALVVLQTLARLERLIAVIAQAPDLEVGGDKAMSARGFVENRLMGVFSATVFVDLQRTNEEIVAGYSESTRREIKKAHRADVKLRWGTPSESGEFFQLMAESCRRQKTAPNPSSADCIAVILREFGSETVSGISAALLFAEVEKRSISGILLLRFGELASMWKKGSVESAKSSGANKLLDHEGIRWAKGLGCTRYDMVGIDRTAVAAPLGGEKRGTRIGPDLYKMQFGGMPVLLPESRLWIPNPLLRAAYSLLLRVTLGRYT